RSTQKRGFTTKRDAELFAATVEVSMARGEYVAPALGRATVGELATDWLARKKQAAAPSSWLMFESAYRVHVMPRWGAVSVADMYVLGVESWIAGMVRAGSGVTTVSRAHVVLSGILSDAVKSKRLAVNPARGVENLPRAKRPRDMSTCPQTMCTGWPTSRVSTARWCWCWLIAGCGGRRRSHCGSPMWNSCGAGCRC